MPGIRHFISETDAERSMGPGHEIRPPTPGRGRRSREAASEDLIDAAAALLAQRSAGRVTVRAIAAAAGVNSTYVRRYFGSKHALMQAAMQRAQLSIAHVVDEMPNVVDGATAVVRASLRESELVAAIARMMLDGGVDELPPENPAMRRLLQRFEEELAGLPGAAVRDPRIIVLCLASATMGYALFGEFVRRGAGLDDRPAEEIEAALVEVLRLVATSAFDG
jgi:AcrR family transcriptional regulator